MNEVDWKTYVDQRFADNDKALQAALVSQEKAVQAALTAAKEAVSKAEVAAEKRFDNQNEFRGQLSDQANTFLPRKEYDVQHQALADNVRDLTDRFNKSEGKSSGVGATWAIVVTIITIGIALVTAVILLTKKP